jgi:hypothetical protein
MTGGKYLIAIAIRLAAAIIVPAAFYGGLGVFATGDLSTFGSLAGFSIMQLAAPIAAIGFLFSSFRPTVRRLQTLGIHPIAAFTLPALLAADARVLLMVGGPPAQWATWEMDVPVFLILGLIVILTLGLAREPDADGRNFWQRHGVIGQAVFVWVGLAALIGAVGLAGGVDTGFLPAMTGGLGAALMPEFAASPEAVLNLTNNPPLSFRPLTPIQMFAAGAGAALLLLLVKDGFGSPPPSEERESGGEREIDPLKVVLPPLPKAPTFLRPRGEAEIGLAARNSREPKTFGRRHT